MNDKNETIENLKLLNYDLKNYIKVNKSKQHGSMYIRYGDLRVV
jgi:hypothetical protein